MTPSTPELREASCNSTNYAILEKRAAKFVLQMESEKLLEHLVSLVKKVKFVSNCNETKLIMQQCITFSSLKASNYAHHLINYADINRVDCV